MGREQIRKKRDLARDRITKIATKIFAEKGYQGGTFEDVARQLDVTRTSLYYHVKNKEDLLKDICNNFMKVALKNSKEILNSDLSAREKLQEFIRDQVIAAATRKELFIVLFEQANALNNKTFKKLKSQMRDYDQVLIKILDQGVKEGIFKISDIRLASFLILGACFWTYRWFYPGGRLTPEQIADVVITLFENGYLDLSSSNDQPKHRHIKSKESGQGRQR
ncbi:MAG: TetR/AcrR family transcriptional regulator [Deltaproteobacteria bacterium]|nr:TetR/AcrR family transcriptional regulator [Deltaproteobacteria bacterium]